MLNVLKHFNFLFFHFVSSLACLCFVLMASATHSTPIISQDISLDEKKIRHVINSTYDTPNGKVIINPIVINAEHALASWVQGNKGGRVIMNKNSHDQWEVVLCSGKAVLDSQFLQKSGITRPIADLLSKALTKKEATLSEKQRLQFDSFNAIVYGQRSHKKHSHTSIKTDEQHEHSTTDHKLHTQQQTATTDK